MGPTREALRASRKPASAARRLTHKEPKVIRWFARHPRYHLHFTPTSGSWVNQVERRFGKITEERIRRASFESVRSLEKAISAEQPLGTG